MRIGSLLAYLAAFFLMYISTLMIGIDSLLTFFDPPSILLIIGGALISLVNFKVSEVFRAFGDALAKTPRVGFESRYSLDKQVLQTIGNYIMYVAVISFIVGLIMILGNLEDVKLLGPSFAISLIVVLYAVLLKLLFFVPLSISLDKKMLQQQHLSEGAAN